MPPALGAKKYRQTGRKASVVATESRIYLASSKYEKGGGWMPWSLGAIPVAVAANAVSKARAARRRRGKMLVGHVRYPWPLSVGFKARTMPAGHDTLRIMIADPTLQALRELILDATLSRQHSGSDVARRIAGLAASYRLSDEGPRLDDATREQLESLQSPRTLTPAPKQFASYYFVELAESGLSAKGDAVAV